MSDMSVILASREFLVGAWTGRFDAAPTRASSGMWSAAPLAMRALHAALGGREPSLPARPAGATARALHAQADPNSRQTSRPPVLLEPWAERVRAQPLRSTR
jgi:membrane carboxypeptidase/penicillin-binding protein PbpC